MMRLGIIRGIALGTVLALWAGCAGDANEDDPDAEPTGGDPIKSSYEVVWGGEGFTYMAAGGEEQTLCYVADLNNATTMYVNRIETYLGPGTHHTIFYRVYDNQDNPVNELYECAPFSDGLDPAKASVLLTTQREYDTLVTPPGVAFEFKPRQKLRIELHYINGGDLPLPIKASTKVYTVPDSQVDDIADIVNVTTFDISLPPHQDSTVGPLYFPVEKVEGTQFFAFSAHTHQTGKHVTVQVVDGPDAPMEEDYDPANPGAFRTRTVYDVPDFNWDNPAYVYYMNEPPNGDPPREPVQLREGYGFRFWCDYFNFTDNTVVFGENFVDEMCYFWGYYYPSNGGLFCTYSDNLRACLGGLKPEG